MTVRSILCCSPIYSPKATKLHISAVFPFGAPPLPKVGASYRTSNIRRFYTIFLNATFNYRIFFYKCQQFYLFLCNIYQNTAFYTPFPCRSCFSAQFLHKQIYAKGQKRLIRSDIQKIFGQFFIAKRKSFGIRCF